MLAGKRREQGGKTMLPEDAIQSHATRIRDEGYTVIERAAAPALVAGLKEALERIEREHNLASAKTSFEGFKTLRINNLLTYDDIFWEVPLHENVLPIVERVLTKSCCCRRSAPWYWAPDRKHSRSMKTPSSFRCRVRTFRSR